jgi:hypothetical protein
MISASETSKNVPPRSVLKPTCLMFRLTNFHSGRKKPAASLSPSSTKASLLSTPFLTEFRSTISRCSGRLRPLRHCRGHRNERTRA